MRRRLTAAVFAVAMTFCSVGGQAHAESWQCAPFARLISGISLFGDAWTWWEQATGKYTKGYLGLICSRTEIGVPASFPESVARAPQRFFSSTKKTSALRSGSHPGSENRPPVTRFLCVPFQSDASSR